MIPNNYIKSGSDIVDIRAISFASMDFSKTDEEDGPELFCVVQGYPCHFSGNSAITIWALLENLATPVDLAQTDI
ncbi:MAG TPA: hypothetical protein V6C65_27140 [Allocoleopsis sp.]